MTTDPKIINYGVKQGAELAFIQNGELVKYYKKGDKASKHCWYGLSKSHFGRPIRWVNSCVTCVYQVADFYRNLGHKIELVSIPSKIIEIEQDNETT